MITKDDNGIRIKPGHSGESGPPVGETVWLLLRHDDKMFGPFPTRHDAIGYRTKLHSCDDYEPVPVPSGSVRLDDVVGPDDG